MSDEAFNYSQARALAGQGGLLLGGLWTGSFLCAVNAFAHPALGPVGNLLALVSVFLLVRFLRNFGRRTANFHFLRRWWTAWSTCMNASLITTLCQYLYFRFLDGGQLIRTVTAMMEMPEYQEALRKVAPENSPEEMLSALAGMSVGDMIVSLLTFNLLVSVVISLFAAMFSKASPSDNK